MMLELEEFYNRQQVYGFWPNFDQRYSVLSTPSRKKSVSELYLLINMSKRRSKWHLPIQSNQSTCEPHFESVSLE